MKNKTKKIINWTLFAVAIAYLISPIDIIPDVPLVGMLDDALLLVIVKLTTDLFIK